MRNKLEEFVEKINDLNNIASSKLIDYFSYYFVDVLKQEEFSPKNVAECFDILRIKPYSNIPYYLSKNSKGKNPKFGKNKNGYYLHKKALDKIQIELDIPKEIPITNNFIPIDIYDITPHYIRKIINQINQCYDCRLFDAVLILIRKVLETLMIETFEKFGVEQHIMNSEGNFKYLSEIILQFLGSNKWNLSRNIKLNIKKIKKLGDLSAHNRRFLAKKADLDQIKLEIRQVFQEIIILNDYE